MGLPSELADPVKKNLTLKSKILLGIFAFTFTAQVIGLVSLYLSGSVVINRIPFSTIVLGPCFMLAAMAAEAYHVRVLKRKDLILQRYFLFLIQFIEISFPTFIMAFAAHSTLQIKEVNPSEVFNSPPFIMYSVLIILSSLILDPAICIFTGIVACLEYLGLVLLFLPQVTLAATFLPSVVIKSLLLGVCGIVAGFVASRIRESVNASLQAKNELIHTLDEKVKEKTAEIRQQNKLLEERQKEILDSIRYAKRIQVAHMPTEKRVGALIRKTGKGGGK